MGGTCITHWADDKYIQNISRKTWTEETAWETKM
jgi:hypothetical protein